VTRVILGRTENLTIGAAASLLYSRAIRGNLTSAEGAAGLSGRLDPKVVKVWYPNFDQYVNLHAAWVADWDKTFGYRQ